MQNKYMLIGVVGIVVGVLLSSAVFVLAGNTDSPSAPGATNSYTLDDIYNRLDTGAAATQSTFTEPATVPGAGTMRTLNEIYDLIGLRSPVPKTGQTTSYAPGDDGALEKGVAWPNPRFTDNLTGLIWLKDANCINTEYSTFDNDGTAGDGAVTWQHALDFVAGINAGTYSKCGASQTDWRLPNVREMQSLVHYGFYNPAVPNTAGTGKWTSGNPFTGVQSNGYWSSTTYAVDAAYAWYVYLFNGFVDSGNKTLTPYVWPVRGGQ